jgi:cytochrome b involved in lipid metabolism
MRKATYSVFIAFWASVATLLGVTALAPDTAADQEEADLPVYALSDLEAHDSEASCWMAIEGQVYDLTEYIPLHPTPAAVLVPWCGGEATEGMRTKGYGRDHSPAAWGMLDEYLIGVLEE